MKTRIVVSIALIQSILMLAHWFVYETWIAFWGAPGGNRLTVLRAVLVLLSISFLAAALLAHRYFNGPVRFFYRVASIWLGTFNFLFVAACLSWMANPLTRLAGLPVTRPGIAGTFFGLAIVASLYGIVNAAAIRVMSSGSASGSEYTLLDPALVYR